MLRGITVEDWMNSFRDMEEKPNNKLCLNQKPKSWIWLQIRNGNLDRLKNYQMHIDKGLPVCEVWELYVLWILRFWRAKGLGGKME